MDQLDQVLGQVRSVLRAMWAQRWLGLIAAWLVGMVGAVVIARMPDVYEASARIYVDTQSVLKPLMAGLAVQPNVDQQIMILSRTLISRPNVEKLIRMADLDHSVHSPAERANLVDSLAGRLEIRAAGGINLYTMAFRDADPQTAQRVVQSLTSMFVESSLGGKRKDTDSAKQFIEEQINVYEKKLAEAENRLKEFKLTHFSVTGEGRDSFSRMTELNAALNQARLELKEAQNARDVLKRQVAGEEPVLLGDPQGATVAMPEVDGRIDALERSLDSLLQRYTEQHPDVIGTRRIIQQLSDQKRQEAAARKASSSSKPVGSSSASVNNNPVYQQLRVSLNEAEANIAALQARVAEYEARFNRFKASVQLLPEVEAEFSQLNRDYSVHRQNYEALVGRRESAAISGQMEASAAMAEFRLIDPPRVFPKPVAPNRLRLLSLALVGALAAGALASFAASQIRRRFFDAHSLQNAIGLPVLGTVSLITTPPMKQREKRSLIGFIAATVALVGSYGAGILFLFILSTRT